MKADERHLKQFKPIQNDRKKIKNAKPKLYEGDRVVERESVYTQKPLNTDAFTHRRFCTQTLLHLLYTGSFTHRHFDTQTLLHFTHRHTDAFTHRPRYTHTHTHTHTHTPVGN